MRPIATLFGLVAATTLTLTAHGQAVRILERPALGTFTTLQAAVNAALPGDVLLVASGNYSGFTINNKPLWIEAMQPGAVMITGTVTITNIAQGGFVVLVGLEAYGLGTPTPPQPALRVSNSKGQVRFDRCEFVGGRGTVMPMANCGGDPSGANGVELTNCAATVFVRSTLSGGYGGGSYSSGGYCNGGKGGDAVLAQSSRIALYETNCLGGNGGIGFSIGGGGGHAYRANVNFGVFASNTRFQGGNGAGAWDFAYTFGGNGGNGLVLEAGPARAELVGCTLLGGYAGSGVFGTPVPGSPSSGSGVFHYQSTSARVFNAAPIASDGTNWSASVVGLPGDRVFLIAGTTAGYTTLQSTCGGVLVDQSAPMAIVPLGIIGISGTLTGQADLGNLPGPLRGRITYAQGLVVTSQGACVLGSPLHLMTLDRAALPDCNGNGVLDYLEMIEIPTSDCQHDLQLDSCQIANGTSLDLNLNHIPDECDH